jgi:uncharacterized Zn finger protein
MTCSCPDWEVPCKHLAAVCYVLAEAFDDDPFGMLAWRGKTRQDLLASLRRLPAGRELAASRPVIDVPDRPLAECIDGFWASALSPARLRSLPPAAAAPPDLLLRSVEPPPVTIGGQELAALLRPAYVALTGADVAEADATGK